MSGSAFPDSDDDEYFGLGPPPPGSTFVPEDKNTPLREVNQAEINRELDELGIPSKEEQNYAVAKIAAFERDPYGEEDTGRITPAANRATRITFYYRHELIVDRLVGPEARLLTRIAPNVESRTYAILKQYYMTHPKTVYDKNANDYNTNDINSPGGGRRSKTRKGKGKGKRKHRKSKTAKRRGRR